MNRIEYFMMQRDSGSERAQDLGYAGDSVGAVGLESQEL